MIVIESGGTKSTWIFHGIRRKITEIKTEGLHPREISEEKIEIIQELIQDHKLEGEDVYFFGAGCESDTAKEVIKALLTRVGLQVKLIETDIYAACIAMLGDSDGVVGILGTGAIAAYFKNGKVIQLASGLGYMLGDEGSGYDIGKRLLKYYFYNELPKSIRRDIEDYFHGEPILHQVYAPNGRKIVAGLSEIVYNHKEKLIALDVVGSAFVDFCYYALRPLDYKNKGKIHFIGSIAYFFHEELDMALDSYGYELGNIEQEAVHNVWEYLKKNKDKV